MTKTMKIVVCTVLSFMFCIMSIGYAALSDNLSLEGSAAVSGPEYDVYISNYSPGASGGTEVLGHFGTVIYFDVTGSATANYTVTVVNGSDKSYIYDRVIEGRELDIEGIYKGTDITVSVTGVTELQELSPGSSLTFNVTITNPRGVTTDAYYLKFNFMEKTGTEILPGNDEFDITFKYNNGQPDKVIKLHENEFIPRPDIPARAGYTFIGWYTDESYTSAWNFEADRVTGATVLFAGWEKITAPPATTEYTVTFKYNNGEPDSTATVLAGALVPPPTAPLMEGYTFIGWYTDAACTRPWNFDTDKVNSNITLFGGWEIYVPPVPPDCNITLKANNGEPDTTIIVLTGEFIPRPAVPVREGYTFIGWYIDEECTTAWNFEVNKVEGHMTLYGGWEEKAPEPSEYEITFKLNNGQPDSTVSVEEGSLVPRPAVPVREGYTFIGWYIDSGCTSAWNFDTDRPTADMTLYGGWEKTAAPEGDDYHSDFMGLVEALLSDSNNCLNHSNVVFNAVMQSLTSGKRPDEDAPVLHCSVNSISGGTMSAVAQYANSKLKNSDVEFLFEVDPDPAYQRTRMRLYMYYGTDLDNAKNGDRIMVYRQIVTRGADGVWYADGTYVGTAVVGYYFGGGNSGKDVRTISPYTWESNAIPVVE